MNIDNEYELFVGVDPGEKLGYCALLVPLTSRDPIGAALWIESGTIAGTAPRKGETRDDAYARHFEAIVQCWYALIRRVPDARLSFAIERPSDGQSHWKNAAGGVESRATKFTLGMRYGFVVASAKIAHASAIYSYPVTTGKGARGWYPTTRTGNLVHAMSGQIVERVLRSRIADTEGAGVEHSQKISRDEVMSFGVLAYHIETGRHL